MNISEIAKLAGVSSAAVSRYFNNGYISEEKKEAIRKVVADRLSPFHPGTDTPYQKNKNDRCDRTKDRIRIHR